MEPELEELELELLELLDVDVDEVEVLEVVELVIVVPALDCMPELTEVAVVVTAPSAFNLDAVTLSIISTSSTVAPEMNISSLSVVTSYKLPNDLPVCLGTNTTVLISGANDDIINVASSVKLNLSPKSQYSKLKKLLMSRSG